MDQCSRCKIRKSLARYQDGGVAIVEPIFRQTIVHALLLDDQDALGVSGRYLECWRAGTRTSRSTSDIVAVARRRRPIDPFARDGQPLRGRECRPVDAAGGAGSANANAIASVAAPHNLHAAAEPALGARRQSQGDAGHLEQRGAVQDGGVAFPLRPEVRDVVVVNLPRGGCAAGLEKILHEGQHEEEGGVRAALVEVEGLGHDRCGGSGGIGIGGGTGGSSTAADAADPAAVDAVLVHLIVVVAATATVAVAAAAASMAVRRRSDRQRRRQERLVARRQGIHDGHCHLLDPRQDVRRRVQRRARTVQRRRGRGHTSTGGGCHGSHGSAAVVKNKNVIGIPAALSTSTSPVVGGWTDAAAAAATIHAAMLTDGAELRPNARIKQSSGREQGAAGNG